MFLCVEIKENEQRQIPRNLNERKENQVRHEGSCPEEENNSDVCKQMDEAEELDWEPRLGWVPVGP